MAYLFSNSKVLASVRSLSSNQSIYTFANPNNVNIEWTTIGFVINRTSRANIINVVDVLCPGSSYNIYLGNSQFLGIDEEFNYIPVDQNSAMLLVLTVSTNEINIITEKVWTGTLLGPNYSYGGNDFALTLSDNWSSVGYLEPLRRVLSNCNQCGTITGYNCLENGLSIETPYLNPCQLSSGLCDGNCFGRCQAGAKCVRSGSVFVCVTSKNTPSIWVWLLILGIIAVICWLIWHLMYKKLVIRQSKINEIANEHRIGLGPQPQPQIQSQYQTQIQVQTGPENPLNFRYASF